MAASLQEVLSATVTTRVVTREAGVNRYLLNLFGFNPGGRAENPMGHRNFSYDIFNDTRTVMQARAPGATSATVTRQSVGKVNGTFPRFAEKLFLPSEELHNLRAIGGPSNQFDEKGVRYTVRQQRYMGQRMGNNRSLMLAGMMRGKMYLHVDGDNGYYDFTSSGNAFDIDWKMPSANQNQLGGIIGTSWANPTAPIPDDLGALNARQQADVGTNVELIVCGWNIWNYVTTNDNVQALAGTSNPPFTQMERVVGVDPGTGLPQTVIIGRLACAPWLTWIVTDEGVNLGAMGSETFTKFVPDGSFWWGPRPSTVHFEMLLGDEPVSEGYGAAEQLRMGAFAWTKQVDDPAGRHLHTLDNCISANYVPKSNGMATAVF